MSDGVELEELFINWKEHKITKLLYASLDKVSKSIEQELLKESYYTPEGLLSLKRLCGAKELEINSKKEKE